MPEFDIERARIDLNEELEPLIQLLKDKLKESLNRHAIDLNTLKQKYELNKLTLNNGLNSDPMSSQDIDESTDVVVMGSTTNEELEELRELKKKKEALQKKLDALRQ